MSLFHCNLMTVYYLIIEHVQILKVGLTKLEITLSTIIFPDIEIHGPFYFMAKSYKMRHFLFTWT